MDKNTAKRIRDVEKGKNGGTNLRVLQWPVISLQRYRLVTPG